MTRPDESDQRRFPVVQLLQRWHGYKTLMFSNIYSDSSDARSGPSRPHGARRDALLSGAGPPELPVGMFYKAPSGAAALSDRSPLFSGRQLAVFFTGDPGRAAFRLLRRVWPTDEYHQQFMKFTTDGRLLQTIAVKGHLSDTGLPKNDLISAA